LFYSVLLIKTARCYSVRKKFLTSLSSKSFATESAQKRTVVLNLGKVR